MKKILLAALILASCTKEETITINCEVESQRIYENYRKQFEYCDKVKCSKAQIQRMIEERNRKLDKIKDICF